ncbi:MULTISPECIES: hypothetical protein [Paenibacillus]|uniref:Radical SAM protein n=1 Tax=Paenibacillus aceti TaxID=1820010 RepID=A0ABQ1WAI5_9BACL|nr:MULTISPECIES: hypothetical protein [Paenibacillus]GGG20248.1 hypothetical protein GCM10010913_48060 [Paenibacillus aceti]
MELNTNNEKLIYTLRNKVLKKDEKRILIASLNDSKENEDNYTRLNCKGYGRVRVFKNFSIHFSLENQQTRKPLFRGHPPVEELRTQVFQLAACNWRCWYCFVDFELLAGNPKYGSFFTTDELIDMYLSEPNYPDVLDLSGGQPDIVPEWCLWTMQSLERRNMKGKIYVWMDDNLGTETLWEVLTPEEIEYMATFPNHSRACCFKGYDDVSFKFNTAERHLDFSTQFNIFNRLHKDGFDLYAYVTLTSPKGNVTRKKISDFIDQLQKIHHNVPLRTIPLEIQPFTAMLSRKNDVQTESLVEQEKAYYYWWEEMTKRFSSSDLEKPYDQISLL